MIKERQTPVYQYKVFRSRFPSDSQMRQISDQNGKVQRLKCISKENKDEETSLK